MKKTDTYEEPGRLFNPRAAVISGGALLTGAGAVTAVYSARWGVFAAALILFFVLLHISVSLYKGRKLKKIVMLVLSGVFLAGGLLPVAAFSVWNGRRAYTGTVDIRCAVISAAEMPGSGRPASVKAGSLTFNGKKVSGKAYLELNVPEGAEHGITPGMGLFITGARVSKNSAVSKSGASGEAYTEGIYYSITADISGVSEDKSTKPGFFESVRLKIYGLYRKSFERGQADTAYALITGQKLFGDGGTYENFQLSGLAHVLAVSGLHIGFLIAALGLVFRRIPLKRGLKLGVFTAVLLFYGAVCGFPPGVIRAIIMGLAAVFARSYGLRHDGLSSLGAAAVLVILIKPLYIANLGFQLSFISVLGIQCLSGGLRGLFGKFPGLPKFAADSISVTIASTAAVFPLIAAAFRSITVWTVLSNLIAVPLVLVLFIALFVLTAFSLILPFAAGVLIAVKPLLSAILAVTGFFSGLRGSEVLLFSGAAAFAAYYACLFFPNKYNLTPKKLKKALSIASAALLVLTVILSNLPKTFRSDTAYVFSQNTGAAALFTTGAGAKILAGDLSDLVSAEEYLLAQRIRKLGAVILPAVSAGNLPRVKRFAARFGAEVWCAAPDDPDSPEIADGAEEGAGTAQNAADGVRYFFPGAWAESKSADGVSFSPVAHGGRVIGVRLLFSERTALCLSHAASQTAVDAEVRVPVFLTVSRTDALAVLSEKRAVQTSYGHVKNARNARAEGAVEYAL